MIKRLITTVLLLLTISACYEPERNCEQFKYGEFSFSSVINGEEQRTTFVRKDGIEIDYYNGKSDTSSVRWINNCEYVVKKLNPKNASEEQSIHMKILSTTDNSYTFEYNVVGNKTKSRGTAVRIAK